MYTKRLLYKNYNASATFHLPSVDANHSVFSIRFIYFCKHGIPQQHKTPLMHQLSYFCFFFQQCIYFGKENPHTLKTSLFSCILTPKVNVLHYNFLQDGHKFSYLKYSKSRLEEKNITLNRKKTTIALLQITEFVPKVTESNVFPITTVYTVIVPKVKTDY